MITDERSPHGIEMEITMAMMTVSMMTMKTVRELQWKWKEGGSFESENCNGWMD